jgi:AcrR family transcriptional regulator
LLNVRSVPADPRDLTARARIRDAAVEAVARRGSGFTVREVAAAAGVSPGLVLHHFGSKDGLRAACDAHVLAEIRRAKTQTLVRPRPGELLAQLAVMDGYATVAGYLVQSMQSGGDLAVRFLDQMVADAESWLQEAVDAGAVRPSRDPAARARHLVHQGLGALLVHLRTRPAGEDLGAALRAYGEQFTLPALEIYTEGLLTDPRLLQEYLTASGSGRSPSPEERS